jgi:lysine 6-dehydrogenase
MAILVLGAGIVGSAAVWDMRRRGHDVTVADADAETVHRIGSAYGATPTTIDVEYGRELMDLVGAHSLVISAVPYRFGYAVASAALATGTHYLDFGGNPTVVAAQKRMHADAVTNGVMVVPDCGLAPGLANVIAEELITTAAPDPIDSVQLRVGALPDSPIGTLGYQLAFNPAGLINEYAEPCEVIEDGRHGTVEPLTRFEELEWPGRGILEAFSTAGGTSTMCITHEGRVRSLEYKTLRYPGHGEVFRALYEIGMFDERPRHIGTLEVAPRAVLMDALARTLPSGEPDVVLVRVWRDQGGVREIRQIEDRLTGDFSALARTTAFPATALGDLILRGDVMKPGVWAMNDAVSGASLLPQLVDVGIVATASTVDLEAS